MPMIVGDGGSNIAAGTYPATLVSIREAFSDAYGVFRVWEFTLDDGRPVDGNSSMGMSPRAKAYRWASNILGRAPIKGEDVEPLILGKPCLVVIVLDADGWAKVSEVMPPMAQGKQLEPAKVASVDDLPF